MTIPNPKILALSGSLRSGSFNKKLAEFSVKLCNKLGAEAEFLDITEYPLPVFNEDLEKQGPPAEAASIRSKFIANDAIIYCSPEYNSSVTAALKNLIDWISRPSEGVAPLAAFKGKTAVILSASPGALGGLRGLVHLRSILGNIGTIVLPEQLAIPKANEAFDENGNLKDSSKVNRLEDILTNLIKISSKISSS